MSDAPRRKLIEVALPLEAINDACKPETENPFLKGHPRAVHVWWARIPLVACRATLLASLLTDPSECPDDFPTEEAQVLERDRLFRLVEDTCKWGASDEALDKARQEVLRHTAGDPPPVIDPFCGRGSIPIEAQRLGLPTYASDLNPVAVLIAHALVDFPARFKGLPPVAPTEQETMPVGDGN